MGVYAKELGNWAEARDLDDRARQLFEKTGDRALESLAMFNTAESLFDQGHAEEATTLLRDVIRHWRAAGAETDVAEAWRELARLEARRGDFDSATTLLNEARAAQAGHSQHDEVLITDCRTAETLVLAGRPGEALEGDRAANPGEDRRRRASLAPALLRIEGWALLQQGRTPSYPIDLPRR